jgi:hypothetical protein
MVQNINIYPFVFYGKCKCVNPGIREKKIPVNNPYQSHLILEHTGIAHNFLTATLWREGERERSRESQRDRERERERER